MLLSLVVVFLVVLFYVRDLRSFPFGRPKTLMDYKRTIQIEQSYLLLLLILVFPDFFGPKIRLFISKL